MKCSSCGHENKKGSKFCENCGAKMGANFCSECGNENQGGAQFCQNCGASLRGSAKTAASGSPPVMRPAVKTGMSTGLKIVLGIAGVLLVGGGALFVLRDSIDLSFLGLGGSNSGDNSSSEVAKITYTTNPAPIVQVGEPFELVYDWNATTKELVQEFINNSEQQVLVNGKVATARVTYSEIVEDLLNGGFKTQVSTDVGQLPVGKSSVDTTISMKKPISNGTEMFGPGTKKEHVQKKAKVIVNDPADPHGSSVDHSPAQCPPAEDVFATDMVWEGDTPGVAVMNVNGWETYVEDVSNPPVFTSAKFPWAHPKCEVNGEDSTMLICAGEYDAPAPDRENIGFYLPYLWKGNYCIFEVDKLEQAEEEVVCPTEEEIFPGDVYWENGLAIIDIENPAGWEPYVEMEDNPSFISVNDELYTDLGCEVDSEDSTMMSCAGPGTIKTGGLGLLVNFPWQGQHCPLGFDEIGIKDLCTEGYRFCVFSGACCPNNKTCNIDGCVHESHDDNH